MTTYCDALRISRTAHRESTSGLVEKREDCCHQQHQQQHQQPPPPPQQQQWCSVPVEVCATIEVPADDSVNFLSKGLTFSTIFITALAQAALLPLISH